MKLQPDWLYEMHHVQGKSVQEIADTAGVSYQAVRQRMNKLGIEVKKAETRKKMPRKYQCNESYFDIINTPEKAYWLGFIMADGSIVQVKKDRPNQLRLAFNQMASDDGHLKKFLNAIESDIPLRYSRTSEVRFTNENGKAVVIRETDQCMLQVNSSDLCKGLVKNGVNQRKTLNELPPELPNELVSHFIRGYFDGDGCFSIVDGHPKMFIASGEPMIEYIAEQAKKHIGVEMSRDKQMKIHRCYLQSEETIRAFMDWMYKDATVYLERKYEKYQGHLAKI